jgi:hypothetical protein
MSMVKMSQIIRAGNREDVQSQDIVVGDVVLLSSGDKVPTDGIFVSLQRSTLFFCFCLLYLLCCCFVIIFCIALLPAIMNLF